MFPAALLLPLLTLATLPAPSAPLLVDATAEVGLDGAWYRTELADGKIVATMGGGVAWGDVDGDADVDLYVTQGVPQGGRERAGVSCGLLYRNDGRGHFFEDAARSGLRACGWGQGAYFEDVEGDGDVDLFLTFVGSNQLWINRGDGTFVERAEAMGVAAAGYNCGAAWLDFDGDSDLDLYLARYVDTTPERERDSTGFDLKLPEDYAAPPNVLLRQDDDGTFHDVTAAAGVADPGGRSLAVVASDLDLDGWTDLFVANDRSRNTLFHNRGDGSFADVTELAGVGVGHHGKWESAMGVAFGDADGNGFGDLLITNYVGEPNTLFLNHGAMVFADGTRSAGIFEAAHPYVGWGAELVDFDLDGRLDLLVVNGHLVPEWIARLGYLVERTELIRAYSSGGYRQPALLFQGVEGGFRQLSIELPEISGRGLAVADSDRDGRLDAFVGSLSRRGGALFLANRTPAPGHWIALDLHPPGATTSPTGSRVEVRTTEGVQHLQVASGGSYLSSSFRPVHAGLGKARRADVRVITARGISRLYRGLPANRFFTASLDP